jgi:ribosomal protein S18 acetylase RimI-like enzyme
MTSANSLALRPVEDDDQPFLFRLYASTRAHELAPLGWDQAASEAFLRAQFELQDRAYRQANPEALFAVVLVDRAPGGRLYVNRDPDAIHVIDISLLPEHRGRGIGTTLLRQLLEEGRQAATCVTIEALRSGRALPLYQRLGFEIKHQDDVYAALEWRPAPVAHAKIA